PPPPSRPGEARPVAVAGSRAGLRHVGASRGSPGRPCWTLMVRSTVGRREAKVAILRGLPVVMALWLLAVPTIAHSPSPFAVPPSRDRHEDAPPEDVAGPAAAPLR